MKFVFQLARLAHLFGMLWATIMAVYYLITSALIANLFNRYCDNGDCDDDEDKFAVFPVLGFIIMITWVSMCMQSGNVTKAV